MKFRKYLFTPVLLFAYLLAMAHSFVPHCHHEVEQEIEVAHHQDHHHQHDHSSHDEDQLHVKHANHFDHGILDFLYCIISESDPGNIHIEDQFYTSEDWQNDDLTQYPVHILAPVNYSPFSIAAKSLLFVSDSPLHTLQEVNTTPVSHRGPPALS